MQFVKGHNYYSLTVPNTRETTDPNKRTEKLKNIFKNCTPFTDCISEINNKEKDHAKDMM